MASGLPVLATRVGGNPELVADAVCGWLFAPGDVADLAARLAQLAEGSALRCQFGCEARRLAESRFSLREMIRTYRSLYLELAERRELIGTRDN
jgi:glycosyltransferase involved in cell wall biosynthesis